MTAPKRSPFGPWRSALAERGFIPASAGGRRGLYMVRKEGPFGLAVGTMFHRHRDGEFCVVLHLGMPLPCAEPSYDILLLDGDMGEGGVRVGAPGPPRPGSTTWWPMERIDDAWSALVEEGLPWLERHADVDHLIERFEREHTLAEEAARRRAEGPLRSWFRRNVLGTFPERIASHEYLLWLAILYEARGDVERARERLDAYVRVCPLTSEEERARLERHREALGTGS